MDWINIQDNREEIIRSIRTSPHEQLLVGRGGTDEPLGVVSKKDVLDQLLDGRPLDLLNVMQPPLIVHETMSIFKVLTEFKRAPVRLGMIVNEFGGVEGIVTQTDLLEVIAGDLPDVEGNEPDIVEREDGSLLIDGMTSVQDAFAHLQIRERPGMEFNTIAGFALMQLSHLPKVGEKFSYEGWSFEIVDMDGLRIDKLLAQRLPR